MFVSGPVATSVALRGAHGSARRGSRRHAAAWAAATRGGRSGPSRPDSPCTCAATSRCAHERRVGARVRPGCPQRPASSSTRSALAVVLSSVWLPATVVTPSSSSSGQASASRIAIASSWPGSQSRMIGVGLMHRVLPQPRPRSAEKVAHRGARLRAHPPRRRGGAPRPTDAARGARRRGTLRRHRPPPVPSTASTDGGVVTGHLAAVLEQHCALRSVA